MSHANRKTIVSNIVLIQAPCTYPISNGPTHCIAAQPTRTCSHTHTHTHTHTSNQQPLVSSFDSHSFISRVGVLTTETRNVRTSQETVGRTLTSLAVISDPLNPPNQSNEASPHYLGLTSILPLIMHFTYGHVQIQ